MLRCARKKTKPPPVVVLVNCREQHLTNSSRPQVHGHESRKGPTRKACARRRNLSQNSPLYRHRGTPDLRYGKGKELEKKGEGNRWDENSRWTFINNNMLLHRYYCYYCCRTRYIPVSAPVREGLRIPSEASIHVLY